MEITNLTQHEIIQDKNIDWLYKTTKGQKTEVFFEYRNHAKALNVTREFDKKFDKKIKDEVNKKVNRENFCEFGDAKFKDICTGSWKATKRGIFKQVPNYDTGEVDLVEASRLMIAPVEIMKNMDTCEEKVKIMFHKNNKWSDLTCEKTTIAINHRIVDLARFGLDITSTNSKHMVDYMYDCLTLNDNTVIPYYKSLSRMGWVDKSFMPYDDNIKFDGETQNKWTYRSLSAVGDRQEWINYTTKLRKSEYFRLQMATSFVSPLIEKLNLLPFILHMWGKTGSGKTVGTIGAMSVWGNPILGELVKTMNGTVNAVMDTCAFLRNIPVALDELQSVKDKLGYDKFVMLLTEGVEKSRMKYDVAKETRIWKNTFLFTGEEPVTSSCSGGGVYNRVIEVDVTGKLVTPAEDGAKIVEFYSKNYGLIAKEYIENITKDMDKIKIKYKEFVETANKMSKTTSKQAMAMACIMLGDYLACKYFFKDEPLKESFLKEFLFDDREVDISERAYEYIKDTISMNAIRFKEDNGGEIWGKITGHEIYIQKEKLNELLKRSSFEFKAMQKSWADKGYIKKDTQGRYYHSTKCYNIKSCYVIFSKMFEELS